MSRLIDVAAVLDRIAKALAGTEQGEACAFAVRLMRELESAAPAKHPDTERLDWLEEAPSERLADVRRIIWQQRDTCMVTRAAIDSAMKEHP